MRIANPDAWLKTLEANPPPRNADYDPDTWPDVDGMNADELARAHGACIIFAAESWADEIEDRLEASGGTATVADVAAAAYAVVNRDLDEHNRSLTLAQYGAAVALLAEVWEHGDELRRWHNLETQTDGEGVRANATPGEVLNPAVFTLGRGDTE